MEQYALTSKNSTCTVEFNAKYEMRDMLVWDALSVVSGSHDQKHYQYRYEDLNCVINFVRIGHGSVAFSQILTCPLFPKSVMDSCFPPKIRRSWILVFPPKLVVTLQFK